MPRILLIVIAVLAALYGAYWVVGSRMVEARARAALADLEARGWEVSYADLDTRGFPSRFDTTVTEPRLAPPGRAVAWSAPFVQALALSYRPNRVIVALPPEQRLTVAGADLAVTADRLRASAAVALGTLALRDARLEGVALAVADGPSGYRAAVDRAFLAMRPAPGAGPGSYDLSLDLDALVAGGMAAPAALDLRATAVLDRPLDRDLGGAPALRAVEGLTVEASAGAGRLAARGSLAVSADGTLEGQVLVTARRWDDLLAALRDARVIDEGQATFYRRFLDEAAQGGEEVELPLRVAGGRITALGLPFGALPAMAPQRQ